MPNQGSDTNYDQAKSDLSDAYEQGKSQAREAFHDAQDEVTQKAGEYVAEAKDAVSEKVRGTQRDVSTSMQAFGGALRAASDHLANADQRGAANFMLEAAGGIERLAGSLKDKPFEEVLEEVRSFGRQNSGALIVGSVLGGLALGRFLKSTSGADDGQPNGGQSDAERGTQSSMSEGWMDAAGSGQ